MTATRTKVCKNCGMPVDPSFMFCLNCGSRVDEQQYSSSQQSFSSAQDSQSSQGFGLTNTKPTPASADGFCKECGARTRSGWLFCMNCGSSLSSPSNAGAGKAAEQKVGPRTGSAFSFGGSAFSGSAFSGAPAGESSFGDYQTEEPSRRGATQDRIRPHTLVMPTGVESGSSSYSKAQAVAVDPFFVESPSSLGIDLPTEFGTGMDDWDKTDAGIPDDAPTTIYDDDEDDLDALTMVYDEEEEPKKVFVLTRQESGERYVLELPATLGRGTKASVRIAGNPFIGRVHASVFERDGELYVNDEGSANHTFVNGTMLTKGNPVKLAEGDTLRLAKEDFAVTIEQA